MSNLDSEVVNRFLSGSRNPTTEDPFFSYLMLRKGNGGGQAQVFRPRRDDPGTGEVVAVVVSGKVRSEIGECWQVRKVLWGGVRRD